ncbi:uncharacterized protein LOC143281259 [Babylonia areolata]|uniref:uncharacterized protein LOC143281259 n=1 Tax=Babylonia areolata TaxID=304850 RepID=UPI003FCFBAA8
MASPNGSAAVILITEDHGQPVEIALLALTAFSMVATLVFLFTRFLTNYVVPEAWRLSLILQDVSHLALGSGLVFLLAYVGTGVRGLCSAAGFFLLLGLLDSACMLALTTVSLLFLQNPGKLGQLSTFRKAWVLAVVVPEKVLVLVLALVPVTPVDYFDTDSPYPVACFPVRQEGGKGAAFGAILFFILWLLEVLGLVLTVLCGFRLWKTHNSRIHASSPNLWQTEKIGQGRSLQRMTLVEQLALLAVTLVLTVVLYTNSAEELTPQWVVMLSVAVLGLLHAGLCGLQMVLWSSACCGCCQAQQQKSKEPYQRLKKLELIKVEGPGKLRLRASWSAGRGVTRRGLVKVYGMTQLKGWAQEIVVLGMLRKAHTASLLQCLWTANSNPYFETMTLLSGQIVTAEARLICLELTSSGTLQEFLGGLDVPLPEPCTRTLLHDVAEGLAALHAHSVLHRNLTSAAVYLKGSVQRLVLRAAVGDFEEAQVYGSLQNGTISSSVSKKHFFLPDVRAFALVALEILGVVCMKRQEEKQPHRLISSPRATSSSVSKTPLSAATVVDPGASRARHLERDEVVTAAVKKPRKSFPPPPPPPPPSSSSTPANQFCAPGAAEDLTNNGDNNFRNGGRIFVVGTISEEAEPDLVDKRQKKPRRGRGGGRGGGGVEEGNEGALDRIHRPPTPFEDHYMEVDDDDDDDDNYSEEDSGMGGYYPENPDMGEEFDDPKLPPITHVREAYKFEFPNQSVFKANGGQDNDYEEIDDIEEEIHREIRYNALHRRREAQQTGGYIVTRTTSGRELFIPAHQHNSSFGNSDSGYVGTSSNSSSRYQGVVGVGAGVGLGGGAGVDDPPDDAPSWPPKAAHRTTSANTISSFGDDNILEVLPGMTDEDDIRRGEQTLRRMLRDREEAKVEQILEEYQHRVRTGGFSQDPDKEWPKLKFSRTMGGGKGTFAGGGGGERGGAGPAEGGGGGRGGSRPCTPRGQLSPRQQDLSSPRPKTAAPAPRTSQDPLEEEGGGGGGGTNKPSDKPGRPLSASAAGPSTWKLRSSFKKNKARNELARALSRGNSFAQGHRMPRGSAGMLVEQKYAAHNAGVKQQQQQQQQGVDAVGKGGGGGGREEEVEEGQVEEEEEGYLEPPAAVKTLPGGRVQQQSGADYSAAAAAAAVGASRESYVNGAQPHYHHDHHYHHHQQQQQQQQQLQQQLHSQQQHQQEQEQQQLQNQPHHHHHHHHHHQQQQQHRHQQHQQQHPQQQDLTVHSAHQQKPGGSANVGKFSSFSSSDSFVSCGRPLGDRRDTSLTSGELTSLSSQADTSRPLHHHGVSSPLPDKPAPPPSAREAAAESKAPTLPGMKLVDSGFDEDSASVVSDVSCNVSPNVSGEACTCSCQSETVTGSESCSCDCSQCHYGHPPSGWSQSQSSCGTWSNSNSFSSYDVQMHRRKLPSKPKSSQPAEEHVLGPDEQYPAHPPSLSAKMSSKHHPGSPTRLSPPGRQVHRHHHHHHRHHHHHSHSHSGSSTSSSAASRRYRELTKKGVPLRVTAVDDGDDNTPRAKQRHSSSSKQGLSFHGQHDATAEVIEEEEGDGPDNALFQDLESQGFFDSTDSASNRSSPTRQKKRSMSKRLEVVQGAHPAAGNVPFNHFSNLPPIPSLEDIIKEIPDETGGGSCSGDETKAFLNRPESELSIKPLKPPAPKPPTDRLPYGKEDAQVMDLHREPKVVHDAELVIDRIFSRAQPANTKGSETFVDPALGLDESAIRKLAMLPAVADGHDQRDAGCDPDDPQQHQPLLIGTDSKHVRYVRSLSDKVELLSRDELLPADARRFDVLRKRLLHAGSFGAIGVQLLDIVGSCWVKEVPPSTADIVDQLTDHVTETEL